MKKYSTILAVVAASGLCMVAQANTVNGSISFSGSATVNGGTPTSLATATGFNTISATITTDSGDYAAVPTEAYSLGTLHTFPLLLVDASSGGLSSGSGYFTPGLMSDYNFNPAAGITIEEMEKLLITATLQRTSGNIKEAAGVLGIDRSTLYEKIKRYEIPR